jgi:class 3 adenylate cyclase/tetratricopeptide (TPR) repeat protein
MICPNCRAENNLGARFCSNCGLELGARKTISTNKQEDNLRHSKQSQSASALFSSTQQAGSIRGERRVVTILFCDIKGSTALAEKYDPEEWADIMNDVFQQLIEPVHRYGGTVARLLGDAILAFFGAPAAHEDDPQRAVLASLDIVSNISNYNIKKSADKDREIQVRVGINTGLVVVGEVDSGFRSEYTAIGDAVNLAARMEQTALPGTVQVSEETFRLISNQFEFESLGPIEVKGKALPVNTYRVLRVSEWEGMKKGVQGLQASLIGRDSELKLMREVISLVKLGRGQIVCLVGEAGIGKSRLIKEFQKEWFMKDSKNLLQSKENLWRETRGISYTSNLPYGTFIQLIRNLCETSPGDSQEVIREKITCKCLSEDATQEKCLRVSRVFEVLLGLETDTEQAKLEGEAFKHEFFEAMTITLQDRAMRGPIVFVFDDLQWADPASIELLIHLFNLVEELPVLFLCAFRPDRDAPSWKIRHEVDKEYPHRYTELNLKPLNKQESLRLVGSLLSYTDIPDILRTAILKKSEGNPFFVEQIVQSLIEMGVLIKDKEGEIGGGELTWKVVRIVDEVAIPDTVQALLQSRIDRLDEDTRQTLHKAAVIGRSFYLRILKEITEDGLVLERSISRLEKAGLLREAARQNEVEYQFSHSLTQETAYKSILRKQRREYHRKVGEAIEKLYPDRIEEASPLLAYHFHEAGDDRSQYYYRLAGDLSYRLYAIEEAVTHYSRAIETARQKGDTTLLEHLYSRRGRALELNAKYDEARQNYSDMEQTAIRIKDNSLLLSALLAMAALHSAPSSAADPDIAKKLLDRALTMAKDTGDRAAEARIHWNLSLVAVRYGDHKVGLEHGETALSISQELGLQELSAFTLHDLAWAYIPLADTQRARTVLDEARKLWIESDNKPMLADNYATCSYVDYLENKFEQAIESASKAYQISKEINNLWGQAYSKISIGWIYFERGEPDLAINTMLECINLSIKAGFLVPLITMNAEVGSIYASFGFANKAREHTKMSMEHLNSTQNVSSLPLWEELWLSTYGARTKLYNGEIEEAKAQLDNFDTPLDAPLVLLFTYSVYQEIARKMQDYKKVVELAKKIYNAAPSGTNLFIPQTKYYEGDAFLHLGRFDDARTILEDVLLELENLSARRLLWQAHISMAELETKMGNQDKANKHQHEAVKIIYYIADRAGSILTERGEDLRTSFLNLPEVKAALAFQVFNPTRPSEIR